MSEGKERLAGLMAHVETRRDVPEAWGALWRAAMEQMRKAGVETVLIGCSQLADLAFTPPHRLCAAHAFSLQIVPLDDALNNRTIERPGKLESCRRRF